MSIQSEINRLKQNVSAAFTAVGNKGGTVPSSKVSGNLASAINSIPEAEIISGYLTTASGNATVSCGFQPDVVEVIFRRATNNDISMGAIFVVSETQKYVGAYPSVSSYPNGYCTIARTSNGFQLKDLKWYTDDWEKWVDDGSTYEYVAIKLP